MIRRTLGSVGGNVTEAAKRLGMTREALSRRIHREKPQ
jgi:ActR/RegA family two-component response regulator